MASQVLVSSQDNMVTISVHGRFDFNVHKEFRDAYETALKNDHLENFVIDFQSTEYIDISALGMLLILRGHVGSKTRIKLTRCNKEIRSTLDISNFNKLFDIQ
jgi:HptB-dependent secretion and biofilm anti anti-sigma factor